MAFAGFSRYELVGRRENEGGGVRLPPNAGGLTALYLPELKFTFKGIGYLCLRFQTKSWI